MNKFLSVLLCGIGNRIWGDGQYAKPIGAAVMGFGLFLAVGGPWWTFLVLFSTSYIYRAPGTGPFLDLIDHSQAPSPFSAFLRALYILPTAIAIAAICSMVELTVSPIVNGVMIAMVIPQVYYLCGCQNRYDGVMLAEVFTGFIIGLLPA